MNAEERNKRQQRRGKTRLSLEVRRKLECAVHGHPPIVTVCFGYLNCARCDALVGDMLGGASTAKGLVVVSHVGICSECTRGGPEATPLRHATVATGRAEGFVRTLREAA